MGDAGGGKMMISWNQGDNPLHVAEKFLMEHRMDQSNLQDIVDFVNRAQGTGGGGGAPSGGGGGGGGGASATSSLPEQQKEDLVAQAVAITNGDIAKAKAALE